MGLTKLHRWVKQSHLDVWEVKVGDWNLKVQQDNNGDWQWCAENWNTNIGRNQVIGTARDQQTAEDRAVSCAARRGR